MLAIIGVSVALFGLVVGRMAGLVRQREKSIAREAALTSAGAMLVAATSRSDIALAALRSAGDVTREAVAIRMCRIDAESMTVSRLADDADELDVWPAGRELGAMLLAGGELKLSDPLRVALRLPDLFAQALVFELDKADRDPRVVLVVAGAGTPAPDSRQALATLASQVALALESVGLSEEVHRRASEARFSSLVANSSDLITVLDADMRIVYQSPSVEQVLGFTAEELIGEPFERVLHPSDSVRLLLRLKEGGRRPQPPGADRVPARPQGRQHPALRDPAQQPARGQRGARRGAQRPRRQRAQGV